jgi:TolA-binding protein
MAQGNNQQASLNLEAFLAKNVNDYYRQEAMFRMGSAYFNMGGASYKNYISSAEIFDDFTTLYPESYRYKEALLKSAKAKELADMYYEAIFAYEKVIRLMPDIQVQKDAYKSIAQIYEKLGQTDRAIEARENYIKKFKDDAVSQKAIIGMLYSKKGDEDIAFRYFQDILGKPLNYTDTPAGAVYEMASVLDKKNMPMEALEYYSRVYDLYPEDEKADMAMFNAALMQEKLGRKEQADKLLLDTIKRYPKRTGGQLASIKYADTHLDSKNTQEWEKFMADALVSKDFDLKTQADLVIIKSLFNGKYYDRVLEKTDKFARENYGSPMLKEVFDIKQKVRLNQARQANEEGRLDQAQQYVGELLKEFPDSPYRREAKFIAQTIGLGREKVKLESGDYKGVIDAVEKFFTEEQEIIEPEKWNTLLQDAYYRSAKQSYDAGAFTKALLSAKQSLVQFDKGTHEKELADISEKSVAALMISGFDNKKYLDVIKLYDENEQIIDSSADNVFKDAMKAYTSFSLYKMTLPDKAGQLLGTVGQNKVPVYWLTSLLLNGGKINFDVNALDSETLTFISDELDKKDPDIAFQLLDEYKKDVKLAERLKFKMSKNIFDDTKREQVLVRIYQDVNNDTAKRFDGYEEVYLDMGILYYKKNNFRLAAEALSSFLKNYLPRDDKRAEGLYYLGKSYLQLKDNDNAVRNYMELLESIPKSVYASAARSELEEIKWRESLTK